MRKLLMHGGRLEPAAQLQPQLGMHPLACVQSRHQIRFDLFHCDVREFVLTEPRPEELQRAEVVPMGLLAPEGWFGAVRKEPVRPLVEADPTVRSRRWAVNPSSRATNRFRSTFSASPLSLSPVDSCLNFPLWSR